MSIESFIGSEHVVSVSIIFLLCLFAIILLWHNRGSDTIVAQGFTSLAIGAASFIASTSDTDFAKILTSLAIGFVALIAFIISSWKKDKHTTKFAVALYQKKYSLEYFHAGFHISYSEEQILYKESRPPDEPFERELFGNHYKANASTIKNMTELSIDIDLYNYNLETIFYIAIQKIIFTFGSGWDVNFSNDLQHIRYWGNGWSAKCPGGKTLIENDELSKLFKSYMNNLSAKQCIRGELYLPPKTKIVLLENDHNTKSFVLKNSFSTTLINITFRASRPGLGMRGYLLKVPSEESNAYRENFYIITIQSDFKAGKVNHPDMPYYKNWAKTLHSALEEHMSDELYIQKLKDWRLYAG